MKRRYFCSSRWFSTRRILQAVTLTLLIAAPVGVWTQTAPVRVSQTRDNGTDLQFHKFEPKVAPDRAAPADTNQGQTVSGISVNAARQMQALQQEKASRTPAQRKIDSNILYTIRMLAGQPAAPGVDFLYTGVDLDAQDNVVVDMVANVTERLLQQLTAAGALVLYKNGSLRSIRAIIPPAQIEAIAASPDVIFISPKQGSMTRRNRASPPDHSWRFGTSPQALR